MTSTYAGNGRRDMLAGGPSVHGALHKGPINDALAESVKATFDPALTGPSIAKIMSDNPSLSEEQAKLKLAETTLFHRDPRAGTRARTELHVKRM